MSEPINIDPEEEPAPPMIHPEHSNNDAVTAHAGANVNVNRLEFSERTLSILAIVLATAAFVMSFWAQSDNQRLREEILRSERESRVLQQQVMDQSALLLREGIRQPGDETNGPAGNLSYKRREK